MMLFLLTALTLLLAQPAQAQLAPTNEAGMTFGHVHLNVSDIEAQKQFWVDQFGAEVVQHGSLTGVMFPGMLILLNQRAPTGGSMGTVMDHFGFKVRDLDAFLQKWRAAGLAVQSEFTGAEGFPNAYVMGPDSVRIELQEDPELAEEVAGYHVHFFTPDYEDLMAWYVKMFGLEPHARGTIATTADAPGMNFSFGDSRTPRGPTQGTVIDHIGFEFEDLDAAVAQLEARGATLDRPVREIPSLGLKIAFMTDPSGVYIELTQGLSEY